MSVSRPLWQEFLNSYSHTSDCRGAFYMDSQNRDRLLGLVWIWTKNECRDILRIVISIISKRKNRKSRKKDHAWYQPNEFSDIDLKWRTNAIMYQTSKPPVCSYRRLILLYGHILHDECSSLCDHFAWLYHQRIRALRPQYRMNSHYYLHNYYLTRFISFDIIISPKRWNGVIRWNQTSLKNNMYR